MSSSGNEDLLRVARRASLGSLDNAPIGYRVLTEDDGWIYISVGTTTVEIANRIGWNQRIVWIPEHVLRHIHVRHPIIREPLALASAILRDPDHVYEDPGGPYQRFVVDGDRLRSQDLLQSRSTRYVDLLVELRHVPGGQFLRLFHLAPASRDKEGKQIWP